MDPMKSKADITLRMQRGGGGDKGTKERGPLGIVKSPERDDISVIKKGRKRNGTVWRETKESAKASDK